MRFFAFLSLLILLAACSAEKPATLSPSQTLGMRMCSNQCHLAQDYCSEACNQTQRRCVNTAQAQALKDYDKYTKEQYAAGQPIDLYASDFERLTPCNTLYDACYQKCAGKFDQCSARCNGTAEEEKR